MILNKLLNISTNILKNYIKSDILHKCRYLKTNAFENRSESCAQNLVIDLSFEDQMTTEECMRLAIDLYLIHQFNCEIQPKQRQFKINICDESSNSLTIEYLRQHLPNLDQLNKFQIHNKSYLDLFDKQSLVYLSPDADNFIQFNSNDIYIMGGIVRKGCFKSCSESQTCLKAEREGIRFGRFPIDHLVSEKMKTGLTLYLPEVFNILSDLKSDYDMESAVRRHVPFWKLKSDTKVSPPMLTKKDWTQQTN